MMVPQTLLNLPSVCAAGRLLGQDKVRLVGGCVRDSLVGLPIKDLDICTPLLPGEVMALATAAPNFSAHPTGLKHGTVTLIYGPTRHPLEVTTLRIDEATDGRHAKVRFTADWTADAARRDLTFNALMLDLSGQVHDYFGGQADLRAGQVRFIGDPFTRLSEDWLRALRYLRIWGRFGKNLPADNQAKALRAAVPHIHQLSAERIWSELKGLVQTPKAKAALGLFEEYGFAEVLGLSLSLSKHLDAEDPVAAWAGILPLGEQNFLLRMRTSQAEQAHFEAVQAALASQESRFAQQVRFGQRATRAAAHLVGESADFGPPPKFPVQAGDLLDLGYAPGPELGQTLANIQESWIASEGQLGAAELLADLTRSTT